MVCVSHFQKFVYLKTHKTGSTSAELALEPFCTPPDHKVKRKLRDMLFTPYGVVGARAGGTAVRENRKGKFLHHHMGAKQVRDVIGPLFFDEYTKIACVRNPFKRLLSQFVFQHEVKNVPLPDDLGEARALFKASFPPRGQIAIRGSSKPRIKSDRNMVSIDGKVVIQHYFRAEHLTDDIKSFLTDRGVPEDRIEVPFERNNTSSYKKWSVMDFFDDDEMVEAALDVDDWVFALAGYSRDPRDA